MSHSVNVNVDLRDSVMAQTCARRERVYMYFHCLSRLRSFFLSFFLLHISSSALPPNIQRQDRHHSSHINEDCTLETISKLANRSVSLLHSQIKQGLIHLVQYQNSVVRLDFEVQPVIKSTITQANNMSNNNDLVWSPPKTAQIPNLSKEERIVLDHAMAKEKSLKTSWELAKIDSRNDYLSQYVPHSVYGEELAQRRGLSLLCTGLMRLLIEQGVDLAVVLPTIAYHDAVRQQGSEEISMNGAKARAEEQRKGKFLEDTPNHGQST